MVSRVTTALLLALAASTDAVGRAPRTLLGTAGSPAESADDARALAAAREVSLASAAPRRALAAAASANGTAVSAIGAAPSNATAPLFVHVNGTSFELDGRKFIAVGANQCACPALPSQPAAQWRGRGASASDRSPHARVSAARRGLRVTRDAARLRRPVPGHLGPLAARAASPRARAHAAAAVSPLQPLLSRCRAPWFSHDCCAAHMVILCRRPHDDCDLELGWRRNAPGPGGLFGSQRCAQHRIASRVARTARG